MIVTEILALSENSFWSFLHKNPVSYTEIAIYSYIFWLLAPLLSLSVYRYERS